MRTLVVLFTVLIPLAAHAEYLGDLNANPFNPNSLANAFGAGSPFAQNSPANRFGPYGSPFSNQSATNPFATQAPRLYDQEGNYRGKLSVNPYDPDSISNPFGRYGSPFSSDSVNNAFGPRMILDIRRSDGRCDGGGLAPEDTSRADRDWGLACGDQLSGCCARI